MGMFCGFYFGMHTVPPKEAEYPKEESGSVEHKEEAEMLRLNYRKVGNYYDNLETSYLIKKPMCHMSQQHSMDVLRVLWS